MRVRRPTYAPSPRRGEVDAQSAAGEGASRFAVHPQYTLTLASPSRERGISCEQDLPPNDFEYALCVLENVVVPEANDAIAESPDAGGSMNVDFRPMLPAVELDREVSTAAGKVRDVRPNGELANEFGAFEAAAPQTVPEAVLGFGASTAQIARYRRQAFFRQTRAPSSQPSRRGGEGVTRHGLTPFYST